MIWVRVVAVGFQRVGRLPGDTGDGGRLLRCRRRGGVGHEGWPRRVGRPGERAVSSSLTAVSVTSWRSCGSAVVAASVSISSFCPYLKTVAAAEHGHLRRASPQAALAVVRPVRLDPVRIPQSTNRGLRRCCE